MIITREKLEELDSAYREYSRQSVDFLVEELRRIRRRIEKGEKFQVEGEKTILDTFTKFYVWADERFPALEDDPKVEWIGMD